MATNRFNYLSGIKVNKASAASKETVALKGIFREVKTVVGGGGFAGDLHS